MKNYCEEAKKIKIDINPYFDLNYLKNYRINKERDFVELTYMNGQTIREFLDGLKPSYIFSIWSFRWKVSKL